MSQIRMIYRIPLAPMGVLAAWSAHARPSARPPIDTKEIYPGTHVCRFTFKHLPNPSEVISEVSEP